MERDYENEEAKQTAKMVKLIGGGIGIFIILLIVLWTFPIVVIGAGHRGVVFSNASGVKQQVLSEGVHFRMPFVESVHQVSVQVQKDEIKASAASKDLQTVSATVVVNWHMDAARVNKIYQEIGDEKAVVDRILIPNVNEVVKAASAKYTAEQLLTQRAALKLAIDEGLSRRLKDYNVILDDVSIVDLDFSAQFNQAIEAKATAEQEALAQKNKLESVKYQAQQKIETAQADAESIRIRGEALQNNPALVDLNAVEKWNGVLPVYMLGDTTPFVNLNK